MKKGSSFLLAVCFQAKTEGNTCPFNPKQNILNFNRLLGKMIIVMMALMIKLPIKAHEGGSVLATANLVCAADTWIRESAQTQNNGANVLMKVSPNVTYSQGSLYLWDVSSISSDVTVTSASLTFFVTDVSTYAFSLYNMRRSWTEGTGNQTNNGDGATWLTYDGTNTWGTPGAENTSYDRYSANLWDAQETDFDKLGSVTIPLNSIGIAVVQGWIDGTVSNYGLTIQNYTGTSSDYWIVSSREATNEANRPKLNIAYTSSKAPNPPLLLQPIDNANGISLSPTLHVNASDADASDVLSVKFYGRRVTTPGADFMFVLIPDPQNESTYNPGMFNSQTNWIVNNKGNSNIVFVTTAGDMVNTSSSTTEYSNADAAIDFLDAGGVWYTVASGNHDYPGYSLPCLYANYFGTARYTSRKYADGYWFGEPFDNYNTYSLFSSSGNDFILINLQYKPTTAILEWADALLKSYSNRRAIIEQHDILNPDNSWNNQSSYSALKDNPNLFLMLCGHMHTSTDGAAYRAEPGDDGHTIHIVLADYQEMSSGNGYMRLMRFSPSNDKIYMTTYSPYTNTFITTSPDQMDLVYDLNGTPVSYTLIGTLSGVSNGSNVSIAWTGLAANTEYEWFATVTDASGLTTTGTTWSFNTGVMAIWDGSEDSDWNRAANWSPASVPSTISLVTIPDGTPFDPIVNDFPTSPSVCADLTINSGAVLTIAAGKALTVTGTLVNSGLLTIKSDATNTGSLINGTSGVNATVERYINDDGNWHFLSSPVAVQSIWSQFAPAPQYTNSAYNWNNEAHPWDWDFYYWNPNVTNQYPATPWVNIRMADGTYNSGGIDLTTPYISTYGINTGTDAGFGNTNPPVMQTGRGYLVSYGYYGNYGTEHNFTGTLNAGDISYISNSYQMNTSGNTWYLVCNPFPSSIDWEGNWGTYRDVIKATDNSYSYWIWNESTGTYGTYSYYGSGITGMRGTYTNGTSNYIAPGQAFFVQATGSGAFTVPSAVRTHNSQQWLKSSFSESGNLRLKIENNMNNFSDEMVVSFNREYINNAGGTYKFYSMYTVAPELWSVKNGNNYSIDRYKEITSDLTINVSVKCGVSGNYTLTAVNIGDFTLCNEVYLEDLKMDLKINLKESNSYSFSGSNEDVSERFKLTFASPLSLSEPETNKHVSIYSYGKDVYMNVNKSNTGNYVIFIYNAIGRMVYQGQHISESGNTKLTTLNDTGIYIVKLIGPADNAVVKIIIL